MSMHFKRKLPAPNEIRELYPLPNEVLETKEKRDKEIIDVFTHTYYMALQNDFIPQRLHNQPVSFLL